MAALTIPSLAIKGVVCAVPGSPLTLQDLLGSAADPEVEERLTQMGVRQLYRTRPGQTTADGAITVEAVYCLGNCALSPAIMVDGKLVGRVDPAKFEKIVAECRA